ncbi:hypothetical protein [Streptomyces sp. TLI_171]|uniref:hypothetical protein n=1 Tax=Streptomyces sp. TLI_171 TaxID=1938859 RepID=UPI0015D5500C|nr:hypothetical protein [Streptomyces sp. TLI_171]
MTAGGQVIAQREVDSKTNEITVFKPLLAPLDLADTVVGPSPVKVDTRSVVTRRA